MDNLQVQEYLTQGTVLASQNKYEEAMSYFDKAERENPMETDVYLAKGLAYANMDELDKAKEQFEKALKINKSLGVVYYHLGSIAILQEDVALGFENYNKAISNGFDDAQVYYSIGLLHEESDSYELAIRNYTKAINKDPMRPDIRLRKAQIQIQSNLMPEALQTLDETILTNPDIFEGYHLKFTLLLELKQFDKAEETLNLATELFPTDPGFILDRASLLSALDQTDESMSLLDDLENAPGTDDDVRRAICLERAKIHALNEDVDSAITDLNKANSMFEDFDSEIMFLLSNCYLAATNFEKLLEVSSEIIEKSEEDYFKNTALYYQPLALKSLGRMDEAMPLFQEAVSVFRNQALESPGNLDAYLLRIMCLKEMDQFDKALELVDYVITLKPENPEPRLIRVSVLEAMGRIDEAQKEAKIADAMLPDELRVG